MCNNLMSGDSTRFVQYFDATRAHGLFFPLVTSLHKIRGNDKPVIIGRLYLSTATCLMRPRLFYVFFVVSRIAMTCCIICNV